MLAFILLEWDLSLQKQRNESPCDVNRCKINWNQLEFFLSNWFSYAFKGKSIESKFKSVESKLNSIEITWNPEFKIMIQNYSRSHPSKPFFLESLSNVWGWSPPRTNQDLTDSAMGTLPSGHPSQLRLFWKGTNTQQSLFHEWYLYFTNIYT